MVDYANKYRPRALDDVVGQEAVVASIRDLSEGEMPHAFLFHGPSGVGKTTIARIVANELLECPLDQIVEIDAASHSKVEDMRQVTSGSMYAPIGAPARVILIDECHSLSPNAWQSLLKSIEEPRDDWFFMFCTTLLNKVPKTIKTRCHSYALTPVDTDDILDRLDYIVDNEELEVDDGVILLCAREAEGSVRQAIVNLSACRGCRDVDEAYELLQEESERKEVIDLCRMLKPGADYGKALELIRKMEDANAEGIRIVICVYFGKVLLSDKGDRGWALYVLDTFSGKTYNPSEKLAPLLLDIAAVLEDS